MKSVRFDTDVGLGREDRIFGRPGSAFITNLAHLRRSIVSAAAARQKAIDLAFVIDYYDCNFDRRWKTVANMLNDDCREPFFGILSTIGLVSDC